MGDEGHRSIAEVYDLVRQFEDTPEEVHSQLRTELTKAEERLDMQAAELAELREDLPDAQDTLREARQEVVRLEERVDD